MSSAFYFAAIGESWRNFKSSEVDAKRDITSLFISSFLSSGSFH